MLFTKIIASKTSVFLLLHLLLTISVKLNEMNDERYEYVCV